MGDSRQPTPGYPVPWKRQNCDHSLCVQLPSSQRTRRTFFFQTTFLPSRHADTIATGTIDEGCCPNGFLPSASPVCSRHPSVGLPQQPSGRRPQTPPTLAGSKIAFIGQRVRVIARRPPPTRAGCNHLPRFTNQRANGDKSLVVRITARALARTCSSTRLAQAVQLNENVENVWTPTEHVTRPDWTVYRRRHRMQRKTAQNEHQRRIYLQMVVRTKRQIEILIE